MDLEVTLRHVGGNRLHLGDQPLQPVGVFLPRHQHRILGGDDHEIIDLPPAQPAPCRSRRCSCVNPRTRRHPAPHCPARPSRTTPIPRARSRHRTSRTTLPRQRRATFFPLLHSRSRSRWLSLNDSASSVMKPISRPALLTASITVCTLSASDIAVFIKQDRSAKHEVAAVPEVARLDVFGGLGRIRFLHEFGHRADFARGGLARADIAILRGCSLGLDAEGNDAPRLGRHQSLPAG